MGYVEEWKSLKDIVEYGDYYEISNLGNLRSVDKTVMCRDGRVKSFKGICRKTKKNNRDYIIATLSQGGNEKTVLIHRMVALSFIPNDNKSPEVNHINGDKNNNCVNNLEWMTSKENQNHARSNGLSNQHGQNSVNSKLKDDEAIRIRNMWETGMYTYNSISSLFNVSVSSIGRVIRRESYNHI